MYTFCEIAKEEIKLLFEIKIKPILLFCFIDLLNILSFNVLYCGYVYTYNINIFLFLFLPFTHINIYKYTLYIFYFYFYLSHTLIFICIHVYGVYR